MNVREELARIRSARVASAPFDRVPAPSDEHGRRSVLRASASLLLRSIRHPSSVAGRPAPGLAMLRRAAALWVAAKCLVACAAAPQLQPMLSEVEAARSADLEAGAVAYAAAEYRIGPNDLLRISVWRQPELTLESVVVRPDGRISVPLLDDVLAAGRTPEELKREIAVGLADFVREPNVTVVVLESRSRRVYVLGRVARTGAIELEPGMRVFDALAVAGGLDSFADARRILIRREARRPVAEFWFDYNAYVEGEDLEQNILLQPGDRIVVPESSISGFLR